MDKFKNYMASRTAADWVMVLAAVVLVVAAVLYSQTGAQPAFRITVSGGVVAACVIAALLALASAALQWDILGYVAYLLALWSLLQFIVTQLSYIANVLVAIDGNTFTPAFIATAVLLAVAAVMALVSAILTGVLRKSRAKKLAKEAAV